MIVARTRGRAFGASLLTAFGLCLLGAAPSLAQEEGNQLDWNVSGSLRVRGLYLSNGTLAN